MPELIFSVKDVFEEYLDSGQLYNIPEYQRGYKWNDQQIYQLLADISSFETGGDEELFYCLQNITVVPDGPNLNVVDGQQRLTTLILLLVYFGEINIIKGKLYYAVRKQSNRFLEKILEKSTVLIDRITSTVSFDEFLLKPEIKDEDFDYQDIYFMYNAVQSIDSWFSAKDQLKIGFKKKLLNNVKLIINRIEGVSEQELFMNLNAGRVQLDGSDLVRAILITRVAKQEMEEYDSQEVKDVIRLNERRIRIGWELDEINAWWSKNEVKQYFSSFTKIKTGDKETIKFDHELHPINLLFKLWAEINGENKETVIRLSLFEPKNTSALQLYTSITLLHRTLKDWFEDRELYHFLGFVFFQTGTSFREVWSKWNSVDTTRDSFGKYLLDVIRKDVFGKEPESSDEQTGVVFWLTKIIDYKSENPTNWYETPELEGILILIDVLEHSKPKENGIPLPFLKPIYFKNYKEDKEHVYPCTPRELKEIKKMENPITQISRYISRLNEGYEGEKLIEWNCTENGWQTLNDEEKTNKLRVLKHEIHLKRPINSIGNLVLLHRSINRGFGNNYYADKRIDIIKNTENGLYVRSHTLKVFIKETESLDLNVWKMDDIATNATRIHNTLEDYFVKNK